MRQIYGHFEEFPENDSALFGLVISGPLIGLVRPVLRTSPKKITSNNKQVRLAGEARNKNNPQFVDPPSRCPQPWLPGSLAQVTAKRRAMRRLRQHALNRRTLRAQHLGSVRKYHKPMRLIGPVYLGNRPLWYKKIRRIGDS